MFGSITLDVNPLSKNAKHFGGELAVNQEIEVVVIEEEEITTGSVVSFDPFGILDGEADSWF